MGKFYKSYALFAAAVPALVIAVDQATKYWATKAFNVPFNICQINPHIGLEKEMSPVVDLALLCNQGVSFGFLGGGTSWGRWLLTAFAFIMSAALLYVLSRTKDTLSRLSLALIIGGALGNVIDRAFFGAVTDFISVKGMIPFFPFIFNIADSAITIGVIGLLVASYFIKPDNAAPEN
ncbi:MAG: signal peptidase II [Alphaproteobacteria bacterium]